MKSQTKGILSVCVTALLWGFLAIVVEVALRFIDAQTMVWFRFAFAATVLLLYFVFRKPNDLKNILKKFPPALLLAGICLGFNYYGYAKGLDYTSPSTTQVFIQMGPIMLAIVGVVFYKEKFNTKQLVGIIIAFCGLVLFYFNQLKVMVDESFNLGFLLIVFAAVSWVVYAINQKKLVKQYNTQLLNLFIYLIPALFYIPVANFSVFGNLNINQWLIMIFLGANTLLAYGFLAVALKHIEAYKVSIIITLNPIITVVVMSILYRMQVSWIQGEQLEPLSALGAILLLGGAVMSIYYSRLNFKDKKLPKH
ncbi:MAG: DMT family transporter [Lentimicrobiaceae bacterium]|nr:DMT family transporter [Lentimicrobiaceae bacterium]